MKWFEDIPEEKYEKKGDKKQVSDVQIQLLLSILVFYLPKHCLSVFNFIVLVSPFKTEPQ